MDCFGPPTGSFAFLQACFTANRHATHMHDRAFKSEKRATHRFVPPAGVFFAAGVSLLGALAGAAFGAGVVIIFGFGEAWLASTAVGAAGATSSTSTSSHTCSVTEKL